MFKNFVQKATAITLLAGAAALAPTVTADAAELDLTILHTNDTNGNLDNAAKRASLLKNLRDENPNNVLVDAGSAFADLSQTDPYKGKKELALMNYLKYDAMTFGVQEFEYGGSSEGHAPLARFIQNAKFPIVSANVDLSGDKTLKNLKSSTIATKPQDGKVYNGVIKTVGGEKVGIFGLTTEKAAEDVKVGSVKFQEYITEAKKTVAEFEKQGVNKIILLSHLGYEKDENVIKAVSGIDVIVGAYSKLELHGPMEMTAGDGGRVIAVQAGKNAEYLGEIDIKFNDKGEIEDYDGSLHLVDAMRTMDDKVEGVLKDAENAPTTPVEPGEDNGNTEEPGEDDGNTEKPEPSEPGEGGNTEEPGEDNGNGGTEEPVGPSENEVAVNTLADVFFSGLRGLGGIQTNETNLGNLLADGVLANAKKIDKDVAVAFVPASSIQGSLVKGKVTNTEVNKVMPNPSKLAIAQLNGAELKDLLEKAYGQFPKESADFLQASTGFKVVFNPQLPVNYIVTDLLINNEKVQADKLYKVVINTDFLQKDRTLAKPLEAAQKAKRITELTVTDRESVLAYLQTKEKFNEQIEGRIIVKTPFQDVDQNAWIYPYVSDLYYQGVVQAAEKYNPRTMLTRVQVTSMIVRMLDLKSDNTVPFTDMANVDAPTQAELAAAIDAGIIEAGNKFNPYQKITRSQMALMLMRAYKTMDKEYKPATGLPQFKDVEGLTKETQDAVIFLQENNIVSGNTGNFFPHNPVSREQTAKFFSDFLYTVQQFKQK